MPVYLLEQLFRKQNAFVLKSLNLIENYRLLRDFSNLDNSIDLGIAPFGCLVIHECIMLQSETFHRL